MSKENAVDNFLESVNNNIEPQEEGPFNNLQVEQKEEPIVEEKVDEEKQLPFHQDPKIQRFIKKEVERLTKDLTPKEEQKFREGTKEDGFLKAFETIIGNDTPEKVNALKMLGNEVESLRQEARSAKETLEAERQADRQAEQELERGFENIEDEFNVNFTSNKKLKSDFVEFIERVAPKDEDGEIREYPDFTETFKLFQQINSRAPNRSKELASRGMNRGGEATSPAIPTDTSWKGVDKFFSTLVSK